MWAIDKIAEATGVTAEREAKVNEGFDPAKVTATHNENGKQAWVMENGDKYVDVSGNGSPDIVIRYGSDGHVWYNEGEGWHQTQTVWIAIPR